MRPRIEYKNGDKIGTCTFVEEKPTKTIGNSRSVKRVILFKCFCGKEFQTYLMNVKFGITKSCGCTRYDKIQQIGCNNKTHGLRKHPLYRMWQGMLDRCRNPKNFAYFNYGGRGIKVCDRWLNMSNFLDDMYDSYVKGLELDRINVNGNYEPNNCRWVTRKVNMNNTRVNRLIEYKGVTKTLSEWSDHLNIPYKTLIQRLNNWNVEKSFTYENKSAKRKKNNKALI